MNTLSLQTPVGTYGTVPDVSRKRKIAEESDHLATDELLEKKPMTDGFDADPKRVDDAFGVSELAGQVDTGSSQFGGGSDDVVGASTSQGNILDSKVAAADQDDSADRDTHTGQVNDFSGNEEAPARHGPDDNDRDDAANQDDEDFDTHYIEVTPRNSIGNSQVIRVPYKCHICRFGRVPHSRVNFEVLWENFINSITANGADGDWVKEIVHAIETFVDDRF